MKNKFLTTLLLATAITTASGYTTELTDESTRSGAYNTVMTAIQKDTVGAVEISQEDRQTTANILEFYSNKYDELTTEIKTVKDRAGQRIKDLTSEITALKSDRDQTKLDLDGANTELSKAKLTISSLESQINDLENVTIKDLRNQISKLNDITIRDLNLEIDALKLEINELKDNGAGIALMGTPLPEPTTANPLLSAIKEIFIETSRLDNRKQDEVIGNLLKSAAAVSFIQEGKRIAKETEDSSPLAPVKKSPDEIAEKLKSDLLVTGEWDAQELAYSSFESAEAFINAVLSSAYRTLVPSEDEA